MIGACSATDDNSQARKAIALMVRRGVIPSSQALKQTITTENRELFGYLISFGADWKDRDVFIAACRVDDDYFVRTLVDMGANINATCSLYGGNGLNAAIMSGCFNVYEYLKSIGLETIPDEDGYLPSQYKNYSHYNNKYDYDSS